MIVETTVNIAQIVLAFVLGPAFLWFLWEYLKQVKSIKIDLKIVVAEVNKINVDIGNQKSIIQGLETKVSASNDKADSIKKSFDSITRNLQDTLDDRNLRLSHIERQTSQIVESQNSISQKLTNQEYQLQKLRSVLR